MSFLNGDARIRVGSYPFNYMVIEDAFADALANSLSMVFRELIHQARPIGQVGEVGELIYEAVNFTPLLQHVATTSLASFVSPQLRDFVAQTFQLQLDENVMLGMHRHHPPSKAGWPHTDFAVVSFPDEPPNYRSQRLYYDGCRCHYADDTRDRQPDSLKTARAIACLYYTANPPWHQGLGGETGLYADLGRRLIQRIAPKNNSLFVFEVSPISYHAYLGSPTAQRNSFIWWYHAHPDYLLQRHAAAVAHKQSLGLDPWDRWTDATIPKYETSTAACV